MSDKASPTNTADLQLAYDELSDQLENSQKSLVQSEKMASLGILSAGIAHEINNPVGYILSNVTSLGEYLPVIDATYRELKRLMEEITADNPLYERRLEVEKNIADRDVEFLRNDTKDLVDETREGAQRVLDIVRGLKNFAHADEDKFKKSDINACLVSTLGLVNNELKYHCRIEPTYGEIPEVNCSAGKIGQVFMNMLINAGHAISESGTIKVETRKIADEVCITIEDNGAGMSEETIERVFDPFYTTKPKGQGTGLGLAISYGIVEEHGGSISVESKIGEGSKFTIRLPIDGPA